MIRRKLQNICTALGLAAVLLGQGNVFAEAEITGTFEEAERTETPAEGETSARTDTAGITEAEEGVVTNRIPGWPQGDEILATAGVVLESSSNVILYNKNMDVPLYPASAVKIMTTLLALENSSLSDTVTMTATGVSGVTDGGVSIAAQLDEEFSMEQCLYAIMLASANDVALQVAEHIGGSVDGFVEMMNQRAVELGCTNTVFTNPKGLPDENQHTTAHDLALIMQAAIANEDFCTISSTLSYTIPATNVSGGERVLTNNLGMLNRSDPATFYEGCLGGKKGSTTASGTTLVTAAQKNDLTLICVVLQGKPEDTEIQAMGLLNYGFNNFSLMDLGKNDFDLLSGGIVLAPAGSTADSFTSEDVPSRQGIFRTYYFSDIPVGTAVIANPVKEDETLSLHAEENLEAAREYSEKKSYVPYVVIGVIGGLLLALVCRRMIKVLRS